MDSIGSSRSLDKPVELVQVPTQSNICNDTKTDSRKAFASYLLNTDTLSTFQLESGANLQPQILNTASIATPKSQQIFISQLKNVHFKPAIARNMNRGGLKEASSQNSTQNSLKDLEFIKNEKEANRVSDTRNYIFDKNRQTLEATEHLDMILTRRRMTLLYKILV